MHANRPNRLFALDALRGLLVALMALDHANVFVAHKHSGGELWGGPFPVYRDAAAFLARLVTHPCAPGFFFLLGASMVLLAIRWREQGASRWSVSRHLLLRGAVLIALKFGVVNRAWELSPGGWGITLYIGVLFALGACTLLGSALVWLPPAALAALTVLLVVALQAVAPDLGSWGARRSTIELLLVVPGGDRAVWSNYPVLPWLGLVTFGMLFGTWLARDPANAFRRAWRLGLASVALFVVLRRANGWGNIRPRSGNDWIGFFNVVKYPPSLVYSLLTMGVNLLLLGLLGSAGRRVQRALAPLVVLGRAPLLFYVTHLFVYAALGRLLAPRGTSIARMLPIWLLGIVLLYPLCLWYGRFKQRQPPESLLRVL